MTHAHLPLQIPAIANALILSLITAAGSPLTIDLTHQDTTVRSGHLAMGGSDPSGLEINANNRYLTLGGKPWMPVMGEFHFSRYPRAQWEDELLKMKAGGIDIVASYIFWIHHEESEGHWNWDDNRDVGHFAKLCDKHGLLFYPRLGPWVHGEARNGGFPDWVLKRCGKSVRRDSEPYLSFARKLYAQIHEQLDGLLWKDGGPVIGVQLENELTRNAGHIMTLKAMAQDVGFDVPLYTMTGWMKAQVPENEVIPLFGGYADGFWVPQTTEWDRDARKQYQFTLDRDDTSIGLDVAGGKLGSGNSGGLVARNPFATCETGGGMMPSYTRRPFISGNDTGALAMVKLGCGSNLPGYYMYHGGANPVGEHSTFQESKATGYPNDLPVINYDFQAPLGQYGQRRPAYDLLRQLHHFIGEFGPGIAPMPPALPDELPSNLDDRDTLRWAARSDGRSGYLFINNYQREEPLPAHEDIRMTLRLEKETLTIPSEPIGIPSQSYFIWPFNMDLNGIRLKYSTAQPVTKIGDTYVFSEVRGIRSEFAFDPESQRASVDRAAVDFALPDPGKPLELTALDGSLVRVLLISSEQARDAYLAEIWGSKHLFLSESGLMFDGNKVRVQTRENADSSVLIFPHPPKLNLKASNDGVFARFDPGIVRETVTPVCTLIRKAGPPAPARLDHRGHAVVPDDSAFDGAGEWLITLPEKVMDGDSEVILRIDYAGDIARAYLGDLLIDDDFFHGRPWEIGLRRFPSEKLKQGVTVRILPLRKDAPIYIPKSRLPRFDSQGTSVGIAGVSLLRDKEAVLRLSGTE